MSIILRLLAGVTALSVIPAAIFLILILLRAVGPCWELYLAVGALQIGAVKVIGSCGAYALKSTAAQGGEGQ